MKVNKIKNRALIELGKKQYLMTVRSVDDNEVIYQEYSYGGVMCSVEKVTDVDGEKGEMDGVHQIVGWGHPMAQFYAFDQLQMWFKEQMPKLVKAIKDIGGLPADLDISKFK